MEGRDKSSFWWSSDGAQEAREAAARGHDSRCLKTARASRINSRTISSHLEIESDIFPHGPSVLSYSQDRGKS